MSTKALATLDVNKPILRQLADQPAMIITPSHMRKATGEMASLLEKTLPVHLKRAVDRVAGSLTVEMNRNPDLAKCTAMSLIGGLIQTTQLGLELGSSLGQAYLVPRWNSKIGAKEATFQVGYRGLIVMAGRSQRYKVFDSAIVYEADEFDIDLGTKAFVHHKPRLRGDRGPMVSVYALAETIEGGRQVRFMTHEQVQAFAAKYAASDSDRSPWRTAFEEMAKKTPLRNLGKALALSVEIQAACSLDEMAETDVDQGLRALAASSLDVDLPDAPSDQEDKVAAAIGAKPPENYDPLDPANDEREGVKIPPKKAGK